MIKTTRYPVLPKDRPPGFCEMRRCVCPTPYLCLDEAPGGTEDAICGHCDDETLRRLEQTIARRRDG